MSPFCLFVFCTFFTETSWQFGFLGYASTDASSVNCLYPYPYLVLEKLVHWFYKTPDQNTNYRLHIICQYSKCKLLCSKWSLSFVNVSEVTKLILVKQLSTITNRQSYIHQSTANCWVGSTSTVSSGLLNTILNGNISTLCFKF